jgi:hypothetical protein
MRAHPPGVKNIIGTKINRWCDWRTVAFASPKGRTSGVLLHFPQQSLCPGRAICMGVGGNDRRPAYYGRLLHRPEDCFGVPRGGQTPRGAGPRQKYAIATVGIGFDARFDHSGEYLFSAFRAVGVPSSRHSRMRRWFVLYEMTSGLTARERPWVLLSTDCKYRPSISTKVVAPRARRIPRRRPSSSVLLPPPADGDSPGRTPALFDQAARTVLRLITSPAGGPSSSEDPSSTNRPSSSLAPDTTVAPPSTLANAFGGRR